VLTFELSMPFGKYPGGASRRAFFRELGGRLEALPGVRSVGLVSQLPLTGSGPLSPFAYNEETARNFESVTADGRQISPSYFQAMNTGCWGRLHPCRTRRAPPVIIIGNAGEAGLAGENAVGSSSSCSLPAPQRLAEVVAVEHAAARLTRDVLHQIYYPIGQGTPTVMTVVVEGAIDPASLAAPVRRTVADMDPDLPVSRLMPMSGLVAEGMAQARFSFVLMTVLGESRRCSRRSGCSASSPIR
jgi:hypothetical protein